MTNKKKLLLLGGIRYLLPVIDKAKDLGLKVITCDYLPNNIAHKYSNEFYNVNITEKEKVLELARELKIDGIMSFAVDPGVITAGYVANKLNLPSPGPQQSIEILQNKSLFRKFLKDNNFNTPNAKGYSNVKIALSESDTFKWPIIVKPVDSAGSKGVSKVINPKELKEKINYALRFSASKKFIIEEFIEQKGFSSDSDCFSINGELVYCSFSDQRFDKNAYNPYTPAAYSWPSTIEANLKNYLKNEIQRLLNLLNMKTSLYNIETRIGKDNTPYIMEVSPRGGGNRISEILRLSTNVDLIENSIRASVGLPILSFPERIKYNDYWAEQILYASKKGKFLGVKIDSNFQNKYVKEIDLWVSTGDEVDNFKGANNAIGTLIMKFNSLEELETKMANIKSYVQINVN